MIYVMGCSVVSADFVNFLMLMTFFHTCTLLNACSGSEKWGWGCGREGGWRRESNLKGSLCVCECVG